MMRRVDASAISASRYTPEGILKMSNKKVARGTETAAAATVEQTDARFETVDIERVVEDPRNERKTFHGLDELAASINEVGLIEPITVTPDGDRYQILTGHRRFKAAKQAGLTKLSVIVREVEEERKRRRQSIVSNVQREDLNVIDLLDGLESLREADENLRTQRALADAIGKSESWVSDILAIKRLAPPLKEKLRNSEVFVSYDVVARIAREEPVVQDRLLNLALTGSAWKEVRNQSKARGTAKAKHNKKAVLKVVIEGYEAWATGPAGPYALEGMLAAAKALMAKLESGGSN